MEKFDLVLGEFSEISYGIESLRMTLENIEELYNANNEIELEATINVCIRNLNSLYEDMGKAISDLDKCIIEHRKKFR